MNIPLDEVKLWYRVENNAWRLYPNIYAYPISFFKKKNHVVYDKDLPWHKKYSKNMNQRYPSGGITSKSNTQAPYTKHKIDDPMNYMKF
jgi:hypothetical protein